MKVIVHSTTQMVELHLGSRSVMMRVWEGVTDYGQKVELFVEKIAPEGVPETNPEGWDLFWSNWTDSHAHWTHSTPDVGLVHLYDNVTGDEKENQNG
jgi:hypothetical protein